MDTIFATSAPLSSEAYAAAEEDEEDGGHSKQASIRSGTASTPSSYSILMIYYIHIFHSSQILSSMEHQMGIFKITPSSLYRSIVHMDFNALKMSIPSNPPVHRWVPTDPGHNPMPCDSPSRNPNPIPATIQNKINVTYYHCIHIYHVERIRDWWKTWEVPILFLLLQFLLL
jgi:hypothetical protein